MKILYCIASLSSKGGTEKVVTTKANYFVEMGHEVHFLREGSTMTSKMTLKKEMDSFFVTTRIAEILKQSEEIGLYLKFLVRVYNIKRSLLINYNTIQNNTIINQFKFRNVDVLFSRLSLKDKIKLLILKYTN